MIKDLALIITYLLTIASGISIIASIPLMIWSGDFYFWLKVLATACFVNVLSDRIEIAIKNWQSLG